MNLTYEEGAIYTLKGKLRMCEQGIHFCRDEKDVPSWYIINADFRLMIVEPLGKVCHQNNKSVTDKIKIHKILSFVESLQILYDEVKVEYIDGHKTVAVGEKRWSYWGYNPIENTDIKIWVFNENEQIVKIEKILLPEYCGETLETFLKQRPQEYCSMTYIYTYDQHKRLIRETKQQRSLDGNIVNSVVLQKVYDENGNLVTIQNTSGCSNQNMTYDENNNLVLEEKSYTLLDSESYYRNCLKYDNKNRCIEQIVIDNINRGLIRSSYRKDGTLKKQRTYLHFPEETTSKPVIMKWIDSTLKRLIPFCYPSIPIKIEKYDQKGNLVALRDMRPIVTRKYKIKIKRPQQHPTTETMQ